MTDLWAEVPSPMKAEFRRSFLAFADSMHRDEGVYISSYVPSAPAGLMPRCDYLTDMEIEELPLNFLSMSYGECSTEKFRERLLDSGIYLPPICAGYFPEAMVIDTQRLASRPVPEDYDNLSEDCYRGEICLIGSPRVPDPVVSLLVYRASGEEALKQFIHNINAFDSPSATLRHIGRRSNSSGSIFLMPFMFAITAAQSNHAQIIAPPGGFAAEPLVLLQRNPSLLPAEEAEHCRRVNEYVRSFILSDTYAEILTRYRFTPPGEEQDISTWSRSKLLCDDLETVWELHEKYSPVNQFIVRKKQ